jgi:hypothetical protein
VKMVETVCAARGLMVAHTARDGESRGTRPTGTVPYALFTVVESLNLSRAGHTHDPITITSFGVLSPCNALYHFLPETYQSH